VPIEIRLARADDAAAAVKIWREAAQWLKDIGAPLWEPDQFQETWASGLASAGELVIGMSDGQPVACMVMQDRDVQHWPEQSPGSALYLHRIARRPSIQNAGWAGRLISWAEAHAAESGFAALRLDCDPRPQLTNLYEGLGFRRVDLRPIEVGPFLAVRYELSLS
jgi:ribosomal protein S18 acetylase RimI-like enzyme